MKIELNTIDTSEKQKFYNLFQYYIYDLTPYIEKKLDEFGGFSFDKSQYDKYWCEDGHWPYFIMMDNELVGFCLLRKYPDVCQRYDIEQFFVLKRYRRQGVGLHVFRWLVESYPGMWQIRVMKENRPALQFWRRCVKDSCSGKVRETLENESIQEMLFLRFG